MKYEITHSCGHTEEVQLYGTAKERERREKAMSSCKCDACRAQDARDAGITEGSDKQLAWALDIRREMESGLNGLVNVAVQHKATAEQLETVRGNVAKAIEKLHGKSDARWFIDNRGASAMKLFGDLLA